MVPLLGVAHLNRPDLLAALLESVDYPVGELIVVDNSTRPDDSPSRAVAYARGRPTFERVTVIAAGANLGLAASINLMIKARPRLDWWAFVNNDIAFGAGDLGRLAGWMDESVNVPMIAMLVEFGAFAINAEALARVGYLDESYHPIYCEDCDYLWRAKLANVPMVRLPNACTHVGSACYVGNERGADNARTYPANVAYHRAKWGGAPWHESFTTPFNGGGDIRAWALDPRRLAEQEWS